jgi:hypothetical protein
VSHRHDCAGVRGAQNSYHVVIKGFMGKPRAGMFRACWRGSPGKQGSREAHPPRLHPRSRRMGGGETRNHDGHDEGAEGGSRADSKGSSRDHHPGLDAGTSGGSTGPPGSGLRLRGDRAVPAHPSVRALEDGGLRFWGRARSLPEACPEAGHGIPGGWREPGVPLVPRHARASPLVHVRSSRLHGAGRSWKDRPALFPFPCGHASIPTVPSIIIAPRQRGVPDREAGSGRDRVLA